MIMSLNNHLRVKTIDNCYMQTQSPAPFETCKGLKAIHARASPSVRPKGRAC